MHSVNTSREAMKGTRKRKYIFPFETTEMTSKQKIPSAHVCHHHLPNVAVSTVTVNVEVTGDWHRPPIPIGSCA